MELQPGSLGALTLQNQLPWKMSKNCEPTGLERAQAEATQNGHEMQEREMSPQPVSPDAPGFTWSKMSCPC